MRTPSRATLATGLALVSLGLYLATLSCWYSADSLSHAIAVDSGGDPEFLNPYHLLLNPLTILSMTLWRLAGGEGHGMEALQALNATAGAACVAAVFLLAVRAGADQTAAVLASAGCAVSGALWMLSTEAEGVTPGLVVHLLALGLVLGLRRGEPRAPLAAAAIGAAIAVAALTYLSGALLLAVAALAVYQGRAENRAWWRSLLGLFAGFVATVVGIAIIVQRLLHPSSRLDYWAFGHFLGGDKYGWFSWQNVPRGFYAFLRTLVLFPGIGMNDRTTNLLGSGDDLRRALWVLTYGAAAVVAAVPLVLLWRRRGTIDADWIPRLLLWAILYAGFALWWVPSDISFWAPLAAGWWVLLAVLVARGAVPRAAAALLVVALFAINGLGLIWPHHDASRNIPLQLALGLDRQLAAEDIVLTSPPLALFLRYFTHRTAQRIDAEPQLAAAVEQARARQARSGGRIVVVDLPFDEAQRARWQAVLLTEVNGRPVWELAVR